MAKAHPDRPVLPHPPSAIPRYFSTSPFDGAQVTALGAEKSRRLALYETLAASHFAQIPAELATLDLDWLDGYLRTRLEIEREERRMHFGALALVSVLFFLMLPGLVESGFANLGLTSLALLLLALLVPYVLVYFGYENRVRAMALGHLRLIEARESRQERPPPRES